MSDRVKVRRGSATINVIKDDVDVWAGRGFEPVEAKKPAPRRKPKEPEGDGE